MGPPVDPAGPFLLLDRFAMKNRTIAMYGGAILSRSGDARRRPEYFSGGVRRARATTIPRSLENQFNSRLDSVHAAPKLEPQTSDRRM